MEVLELGGCQYAGKAFPTELPPQKPEEMVFETSDELQEAVGTWIADSVKGEEEVHRPEGTPEGLKSPIGDNLVTKWEVRRKNGEVFEFETFALIRQWIEQGKITAGDEIAPSGGTKHLVEVYPGTADLFGNVPPPTAPARQAFAAKPALQRLRKKRTRQLFLIVAAVLIAAAIGGAPFGLRQWQLREGKTFVEGLIVGVPSKNIPQVPAMLSEAKNLLREGNTESLPKASNLFVKILSLRPSDPEILSSLAETWTEIGALTGDPKELARAAALIRYSKALDKDHVASKRAEGRWLWRTGKTGEALALLKEHESLDLDTQLLLAKIAAAQADYTNATIALSEALKREPNSISLLIGLVDVFERQSKFAEATSYLKRAEALASDPAPYTERLKSLYQKAGDTDSLETLYRKSVASRSPTAESDHFELVKLLGSQKRNEEVIQESLNYFADYPEGRFEQEIRKIYDAALSAVQATQDQGKTKPRSLRSRNLQRSR
jgi:tetratricopeptide (TPR) repeat protein